MSVSKIKKKLDEKQRKNKETCPMYIFNVTMTNIFKVT